MDDGVFAPRAVRLTIGEAVPQVDNTAAAHIDAARRADLAGVSLEVRAERVGDLSPAVLDSVLDTVVDTATTTAPGVVTAAGEASERAGTQHALQQGPAPNVSLPGCPACRAYHGNPF